MLEEYYNHIHSSNHHHGNSGNNSGNSGQECDDGSVEGGTINYVRQEKSFKIHMDDDDGGTSNDCMPQSHSQAHSKLREQNQNQIQKQNQNNHRRHEQRAQKQKTQNITHRQKRNDKGIQRSN